MRARSWSGRGMGEEGRVNVTPLIDVMMCLIVFYLIVGHLVLEQRGQERLPISSAGFTPTTATDPLVLTVLDDGLVLVSGQETETERLESILSGRVAREPGVRVQLRAGRDFQWRLIDPVVRACRAAGVVRVELATEREQGGTP